jgi:hypothetical protein
VLDCVNKTLLERVLIGVTGKERKKERRADLREEKNHVKMGLKEKLGRIGSSKSEI